MFEPVEFAANAPLPKAALKSPSVKDVEDSLPTEVFCCPVVNEAKTLSPKATLFVPVG